MFISGTHSSDGSECVSVFGYMFMRGEHGTCVEARDQIHVSFSVILHFSSCDTFLLNLELAKFS